MGLVLSIFENVIILILLLYFIYSVFKPLLQMESLNLKYFVCVFTSIAICMSSLVVLALGIFQVGILWEEVETEMVVEVSIKQISFLSIEIMWVSIGCLALFAVWRFIYSRQIIPGRGSIMNRVKDICSNLRSRFVWRKACSGFDYKNNAYFS